MSIKGYFNNRIAYHDVNMWVMGAAYGVAVYLILVILQPFGISMHGDGRFVKMLPFAFVTMAGCIAPYYILPLAKKDFFYVEDWTRGRYAILLLAIITIISIGNMAIFVFVLGAPVTLKVAWIATWQTLAMWCMIFGIIMLLPEKKKQASKIQEAPQAIVVRGSGKNEELTIRMDTLLYVESARNYCNIVTTEGETQIRSTMTAIEEQLAECKTVRKCHRAYLANTANVMTISGNSTTGHKMIMKGGLHSVPISRQYVKEMMALCE